MCPGAGDSDEQTSAWLGTFAPPITSRLNAAASGANLTDKDTFSLISLCPFETVFLEKGSPFCSIFAEDQISFPGFEYAGDLDKYYGTGYVTSYVADTQLLFSEYQMVFNRYGQELGRVQGVGYVNELIARLTNSPVRDNTQTNRTLDSNPATFPLNRSIYADFSHDNQMIAIYAALGLFNSTALNPTQPDPAHIWRVSDLVPFSARMVVERLDCGKQGSNVRIFVNDALQPLEFCGGDPRVGICTLKAFVESQSYSRNDGEGDFEKCFLDS